MQVAIRRGADEHDTGACHTVPRDHEHRGHEPCAARAGTDASARGHRGGGGDDHNSTGGAQGAHGGDGGEDEAGGRGEEDDEQGG